MGTTAIDAGVMAAHTPNAPPPTRVTTSTSIASTPTAHARRPFMMPLSPHRASPQWRDESEWRGWRQDRMSIIDRSMCGSSHGVYAEFHNRFEYHGVDDGDLVEIDRFEEARPYRPLGRR